MKSLLAASAAFGLALTGIPAIAQTAMTNDMVEMTTIQQSAYDSWPLERRSAYDAWPTEAQKYFWTLNQEQMRGWWLLTDDQRVQVLGMAPQQRAAAWTAIMNQMTGATTMPTNPGPASARTTTALPAEMAGNIDYRRSERVQATPGDQGPPTGEMPICSANQQDNCINAWEAGKRGRGVNRPLDDWPGKPASEM